MNVCLLISSTIGHTLHFFNVFKHQLSTQINWLRSSTWSMRRNSYEKSIRKRDVFSQPPKLFFSAPKLSLTLLSPQTHNVYFYHLWWLTLHKCVFLSRENQKLFHVNRGIISCFVPDPVLITIFYDWKLGSLQKHSIPFLLITCLFSTTWAILRTLECLIVVEGNNFLVVPQK